MEQLLTNIKAILELGWPAIVLIMLVVLWRASDKRVSDMFAAQDARIQYLEKALVDCLDGKI